MHMIIVGIDEVGRGCWAGPLVAGAVALTTPIPGLKDSKKLSAKKRESLSKLIYSHASATGLGWVEPLEIDKLGLTASVRLAMQRAMSDITILCDQIIIDGNYNYLADLPNTEAIIKADDTVPAVSAASIIAKVARDSYMKQIAADFEDYGFDQHVGYGTALHMQRLKQYGSCTLHRQSFKPIRLINQIFA